MPPQLIGIGGRQVGPGELCFIIAEAGVNHNGRLEMARQLVDVAVQAGADAVKFQTFKAESLVTKRADKAGYQKDTTGTEESQYEMIKKLELSEEDFKDLFAYAREKGIIFLSSPFDKGSVDLLDALGVPAYKIPSGEITNFSLLRYIARKKKPIILSTGMSTLGEIGEALEVIRKVGTEEIILLHCITNYPAKIEDMNLKVMETLINVFNLPVGLSDHTLGVTVPIAAVALGACVIEKHFTLDTNLPGPDHRASLEPDELKQMVRAIRDVERAKGDGVKKPTKEEEENKKAVRRSIVARVDIPEGAALTEEMLDVKRAASGVEAEYVHMVVGRRTKEAIAKDSPVTWDKIRGEEG